MTSDEDKELIKQIDACLDVVKAAKSAVYTKDYSKSIDRKYAQTRIFAHAAILLEETAYAATRKNLRAMEVLSRVLIESYINMLWLGLEANNKNYVQYVVSDCEQMIKQANHIIKFYKLTKPTSIHISEWQEIIEINKSQIREAKKETKMLGADRRMPSIVNRAKQIDRQIGFKDRIFEEFVTFDYSMAHNAVHVSNRQLNRMFNEDVGQDTFESSVSDVSTQLQRSLIFFLGMFEDAIEVLKLNTSVAKYWREINTF
jgi:hypothetical protein